VEVGVGVADEAPGKSFSTNGRYTTEILLVVTEVGTNSKKPLQKVNKKTNKKRTALNTERVDISHPFLSHRFSMRSIISGATAAA
jgi:hypothetical protein